MASRFWAGLVVLAFISVSFTAAATSAVAAPPSSAKAPAGPVIVAIETAVSTQLTVDFTRPYDGGSAITAYQYSTDNGATWSSFGSTLQSQTITALVDSTLYNIRVRAVNAVGSGTASLEAQAAPGVYRAPHDITQAMRYSQTVTGSPVGSIVTAITNNDDDSTTIPSPFSLNFFGQKMDGLCLTTNGTISPVSTSSTGCSDNFDTDLKEIAESGSAPVIAALANDGHPGRRVVERLANVAAVSSLSGTLTVDTTRAHGITTGIPVCVFVAADNINNGLNVANFPINQWEVCGSATVTTTTTFDVFEASPSYLGRSITVSDMTHLTNAVGYVFDAAVNVDEVTDGFGDVAELYQGTLDLAGTPADASDDSFVYTAYRVGQYDDENARVLTNTWQIVLTPKLSSGNSTDGYGFDIEFNYGSIQDEDDGYSSADPTSSCSSFELDCRTGIGTANYDAITAKGDPYELFAKTPWRDLMDWGATSAMTRNSLNSTVLGRYAFTFAGGVPTNFAVPVMDGSGTTTVRPGDETPASGGSGGGGSAAVVERETVVVQRPAPVRTFEPVQQPVPSSSSSASLRQGPTLLVGGRPADLQVVVPNSRRLELREGDLSISLRLPVGTGNVAQKNGTTEASIAAGSTISLAGSGLRPGTFAQVFLPLGGGRDSVELGRYEIGDDGTFSSAVPLDTLPFSSMPVPIGPRVLQMVSYDKDGNQIVLDLLVNVTQPLPAPEFNRSIGEIPGVLPGNSLATRAGIPVPLTVTGLADKKLVVLEGDGWSIGLNVLNDSGTVEPTDGGAFLKLVRDAPFEISGDGFMPGTRADIWVFSEPTLVGSVMVSETGEFFAEVSVDANFIAVGDHTLQLQGIGEDGYVRSANLGVSVSDNIISPWWTLIFIGLGLVLFGSLRRWGPIRKKFAHNLAAVMVFLMATPAVILGWISTVTAVAWWGLALGLVAMVLYYLVRPKSGASFVR
jgi:hypothetical protein